MLKHIETAMILRKYWKSYLNLPICILLVGCSTSASLVPVKGPLSKQTPVPTIQATVNGIMGNTGEIKLAMPDGESCFGKWSSAAGAGISAGTDSLIGTYGPVYGVGTSGNTGTGQNPGLAFLSCSQERTIQIEFVTGAGIASGFGIAKDNKGNIYTVQF
ncbi:MAG: hypothetical protein WBO34_05305 [Gammaproteobacteria bacterium]